MPTSSTCSTEYRSAPRSSCCSRAACMTKRGCRNARRLRCIACDKIRSIPAKAGDGADAPDGKDQLSIWRLCSRAAAVCARVRALHRSMWRVILFVHYACLEEMRYRHAYCGDGGGRDRRGLRGGGPGGRGRRAFFYGGGGG